MVREQHSDSKLNQELGDFPFHCTPHGHAGMFGANGKDNAAVSESFSINKVVDTTKGEILGLEAKYTGECHAVSTKRFALYRRKERNALKYGDWVVLQLRFAPLKYTT
jgi:hypothetical protein